MDWVGLAKTVTMFSEQLDAALTERGWTHGEMARRMHNRQQNVSRWVSAEVLPKWPTVSKIAEALSEDPKDWELAWQQSQKTADRVSERMDRRELVAVRKALQVLLERVDALAERLDQ